MITNSRQIRISLFEIDAADPCENPCHDNHLKEECKGLYDDDKQLAQHYSNIFFGENEKYFLRNLSGINIIIWHRNIDYKLTNKSEWNKNSQKFRNKLRSLNDDLYKKMDEENDIESKVNRLFEARYSIFVQLLQNGDLDKTTFNNQQLYSRIEETYGSKYSQEIAIRIVEQSQAKLNLELDGKSDSKKEEINEVEEILNEMGITDNDRKDITSSTNSNKQSKKNRKKNQNKKHVEATKVNIVKNTKQYLESDVEDNTKNNQSLNNEISESFQMDKNFNEDNVENDEDNEGW
uniref:Uncharacterized protein n=1 Tax=Meloidogyne floridensis TaxID=298350 RepID=A0A915P336_9BILA